MFTFSSRIWLAAALLGVASATLPSYIHVCRRNDPDINNCILNSIEQLREKLATGIEELSVPSLEPLRLPKIRLNMGSKTRNNNFDVNITNLEVFGVSKFKVNSFRSDMEKLNFDTEAVIPRADFYGKYKIDAVFLLFKLEGEGNFNGTYYDVNFNAKFKGRKIVKNDKTYTQFRLKLNIKNVNKSHVFLDNLFNGNKELGAAYNDVLNQNSELLVDEIKPALGSALGETLTEFLNAITSRFTYDELFPL